MIISKLIRSVLNNNNYNTIHIHIYNTSTHKIFKVHMNNKLALFFHQINLMNVFIADVLHKITATMAKYRNTLFLFNAKYHVYISAANNGIQIYN